MLKKELKIGEGCCGPYVQDEGLYKLPCSSQRKEEKCTNPNRRDVQYTEFYLLLQKVRVLMEKMRGKIMIHGHITDLQVRKTVVSTWLCSL